MQGKKCFIITPIGNNDSDIFRKTQGVIESVIKPILLKNGFSDIKPAYEIMESGMIANQIIRRITDDDLVVANLTGNNPNVMYELAIRHAVAKPIIHICENGTVLPFDIKDSRTIFYTDDMLGTQELKRAFKDYVTNIDYSKQYPDNPIHNAVTNFADTINAHETSGTKLCFSLTTNGERLEDQSYPTKTSPSGYGIKIFNLGGKPFYLESFSLGYGKNTIMDCILSEETVIPPYQNYEFSLDWQEYDSLRHHCKRAALEKCEVEAYEVGGKTFYGEMDLSLPYLQTNYRGI